MKVATTDPIIQARRIAIAAALKALCRAHTRLFQMMISGPIRREERMSTLNLCLEIEGNLSNGRQVFFEMSFHSLSVQHADAFLVRYNTFVSRNPGIMRPMRGG